MKHTNHTLPDWFNGTVYDEGETVTNPFSGESYDLNAGEVSMYDLIMGINYVIHRYLQSSGPPPTSMITNIINSHN